MDRVFRMISPIRRMLTLSLTLLGLGTGAQNLVGQDQTIVIKLATLAPRGTVWHDLLLEMGDQWARASGGRVELRVYPGGVAGEEADVLRKMRIGQLQAGSLSLAGLQRISSHVTVLAIPMLMETPEDLAKVRTAMEPRLERLFADNGYVLLNWGDVGWIRFFFPDDDVSPEAAKRRKTLAWSDDALQDLWRQAGFRPVILNLADVLPGLQTGLVDAMGSTPLFVLSNQWFPFVPYMVDMPWSPLVGATLVDRRTWEQIPAEIRPELIRIAREVGAEIQVEIQKLEAEAIEAMKARGLTVVKPTPQEVQAWRDLFESSYPLLRGTVIPADWFDEALQVVREGKGG